jgi:hypothetical protein
VVAAEQVALLATGTEAALADGYRGLRVAADCTALVAGGHVRGGGVQDRLRVIFFGL